MGISVPRFLKSVQAFGKLPTYPSSDPTFCPQWEVRVNIGVRGGASGHFMIPQLFYWLFSRCRIFQPSRPQHIQSVRASEERKVMPENLDSTAKMR